VSGVPATRPVGRPPREVPQGDVTRQRIVRMAVELFAELGYHGTGVAEIARRSGVRQGALYYHIGSKEQLLYDVIRAHVDESFQGESTIAASDLAPDAKLAQLIRHHVATMIARRDEVGIYLREAHHLTGARARELQRLRDAVDGIWQDVLAEGVREGTFREVDQIEVNALLGTANTVALWYRPEGTLSPEEIADRFVTLAVRGLGA
jgi:TetR/AcrR family transcriptional regulator, cholesterol catabolism regulator